MSHRRPRFYVGRIRYNVKDKQEYVAQRDVDATRLATAVDAMVKAQGGLREQLLAALDTLAGEQRNA